MELVKYKAEGICRKEFRKENPELFFKEFRETVLEETEKLTKIISDYPCLQDFFSRIFSHF